MQEIKNQQFGECDQIICDLLTNICTGKDPFLVGVDFKNYVQSQEEIERIFKDQKEFCRRTMITLSIVGKVQVDKQIQDLCEKVWRIGPVDVPKPSQKPDNRVRSSTNLLAGSQGQFSGVDSESHDGMSALS